MPKYQMTVSEKQAEILVRALDIFSRIGLGQFEEVLQVYDANLKLSYEQREQIRAGLVIAKGAAGHPPNGSYGIHNPEVREDFRAAFDVMQAVRHQLAQDKSHAFRGPVAQDTPHKIGKENLPEITKAG
jgi:hypothetical protein